MSRHDDLFHELGRTLDVSPSRDFADGVRARIARRRLIVRSTMSGLAIAASVLLVVVIRWPEPAQPVAIVPTDAPPVVALSQSAPPAPPSVAPRVPPPAVVRHSPAPPPRRTTPEAESDRLLVVTNQMAVLRAVWAGHRVTAGETEAPPVEVATAPDPAPIVIEPVRVLPVVIADQHTPIERLPIIRRAVAALETK